MHTFVLFFCFPPKNFKQLVLAPTCTLLPLIISKMRGFSGLSSVGRIARAGRMNVAPARITSCAPVVASSVGAPASAASSSSAGASSSRLQRSGTFWRGTAIRLSVEGAFAEAIDDL